MEQQDSFTLKIFPQFFLLEGGGKEQTWKNVYVFYMRWDWRVRWTQTRKRQVWLFFKTDRNVFGNEDPCL